MNFQDISKYYRQSNLKFYISTLTAYIPWLLIKPNQLVIVVIETTVHTSNGLTNSIVTLLIVIFEQGKICLLDI